VVETARNNVFVNCPFDKDYISLLRPLLFTIVRLEYSPRIALESSDSGELRLDKIRKLIGNSRYSIHDLSRIQATRSREYYRLNMPFELGLDFGCRRYGSAIQRRKKFLVLGAKRYAYMRAISDLAGIDIKYHDNNPIKLIRCVRNWFSDNTRARSTPSASQLWYEFNDFMTDFSDKRKIEGFKSADLKAMPTSEYLRFMKKWVSLDSTKS